MKSKSIRNIFILFVVFSSLFLEAGFAINNQETSAFQRANVYYEQGNFDEAIKQYNSILENGSESGNLYYNLGNCYFKKGQLGKALLNYEKARRFIPLDKDLESNYAYACSLIKGQSAVSKKSLPIRALNNFFEKITLDGLTILLSALYILILIAILISLFFKPCKKHALTLACLMGLFFIVCFAALREKIAILNKEAIVINEQVDAKFEPKDSATTHFTLYEGMKAEVIFSKDNWHKVRRQDNKNGWIENSALAIF